MLRELGAEVDIIPAGDSHIVQNGGYTGFVSSLGYLYSVKGYNYFPYMLNNMRIGLHMMIMVTDNDVWDSLPDDVKAAISSVSDKTAAQLYSSGIDYCDDIFRQMIANDKTSNFTEITLSDKELTKFVEHGAQTQWSIWSDKMEERGISGNEIFAELIKLIDEYSPD